jgi:Mn2+/Fe2+ NRAMP family transporter
MGAFVNRRRITFSAWTVAVLIIALNFAMLASLVMVPSGAGP